MQSFLKTPGVCGTGDVASVLETPNLESAKPGFLDRVIHRQYLGAGAGSVATFERAWAKLPRVQLLGA